ncbi:histone-lysine N-methyltransferase, H3 lysine-79 specific-like [Papaver somniferum]|uniref:histone-lysine N-methyltransferase, H3 lysine-79 specific-like n=1 Tax=Papaver somniferum TaxID=3469 RepID=UPI000E6F9847|nr:histone-lysine N-methyltransferase, H3 lysine-79 specific-like [Papaver somniferum]
MSRCYPYPPPFLLESEIRKKKGDEKSLFLTMKDESIKKREETEKVRKKERKRENREKKEKKKKVQNIRVNSEFENKEHTHKERCKDEGSKIDHNGRNHPKRREDDEEEVEKSGLTEEHDQPASLQNLGDISDSSQDSRKRKRTHIPVPNLGNVLRFRLSLSKNKDNKNQIVVLPPSSMVEKSSCCTSERLEGVVQNGIDDNNSCRSVSSQLCSTSGTTEVLLTKHKSTETAAMARTNCFDESCFLDTVEDTQYRNLIENWTPPSQSLAVCCTDLDDQDWLFGSKQTAYDRHKLASSKRVKATSSVEEKPMVSPGLWPSACYLADADMYALPYTIPY